MTTDTTVFVSGATGFIALHIVNDLLKAGYTVIGSGRSQEKNDGLLKNLITIPNYRWKLWKILLLQTPLMKFSKTW